MPHLRLRLGCTVAQRVSSTIYAMARTTDLPPPHGDPRRYRAGCRCEKCMAGNAEYHRARRARIRSEAVDNVTPLPLRRRGSAGMPISKSTRSGAEKRSETTPPSDPKKPDTPHVPGETERAVIAECSSLSMADQRPAMVALATRMARILDNAELTTLWPTTSRQLQAVLNDLRGGSRTKRKGRLAAVQGMTNRRAVQ